MTVALNIVGLYFGLIAAAAFFSGSPAMLPAVMAALFLTNTPISKAIEQPLPWYMTFMGINLAMMFYCMTFQTTAMNIASLVFMAAALLNLFVMMQIQWADRLYSNFGMVLIVFVTVSTTAHIALEGVK